MNRPNTLTDGLLADSAHFFRVFAAEQFPNPQALTRQLKPLVESGALCSSSQSVVLVKDVECVHVYMPGDTNMVWEQLSTDLRARWSQHEPIPTQLYWASRRTVNLFGGCMPGRLSHLDAVSHDLGMTALTLRLFREDQRLRDAWVAEEHFEDVFGQAKPDGALADSTGPRCLIEFAGQYSAERLSRLGLLADRLKLPLQFWSIRRGSKSH